MLQRLSWQEESRIQRVESSRNGRQKLLASKEMILDSLAMPKWVKTVIAVLLLPLCVGMAKALWVVLRGSGHADTTWVATLAGGACWWVIFLLLPKPMWIYVFGHELTHALWTWLFWGRVKKFKATANGGHVVITKNNFLIALAPYFFPLYTFLVVVLFVMGHWIWGWSRYQVWWHLLLGASYAFHVTLTWHILKTRQSDITQQGYLFSAVVILLGNVSMLLVGIPLLTGQGSIVSAFGLALREAGAMIQRMSHWL